MLNSMYKNLNEITSKPAFKPEWNDKDEKTVNKAIKNLFSMKTLTDHRGQRRALYTMEQIEDFFGLPYTSSSSFAMVSNCNTECFVDDEKQFNIEYFALAQDNKVVMSVQDKDENERLFELK